jgi:hypothetical protein
MKWVYVIAMAILAVGSCSAKSAQSGLMSDAVQLQSVAG